MEGQFQVATTADGSNSTTGQGQQGVTVMQAVPQVVSGGQQVRSTGMVNPEMKSHAVVSELASKVHTYIIHW